MRQAWRQRRELRREAGPAALAFVLNILIAGWVYAAVEGIGPVSGPWWALVTGSTTGYGDVYPSDTLGRGIAAYLMLSSIVLLGYLQAQITKVVIPDPHLFSDEEQEFNEAHTVAQTELLANIAMKLGIDPLQLDEYKIASQLKRPGNG